MKETQKEKYLRLTEKIAADFSKDQSTKVGSMMLNDEDTTPISFGYNGMLRGLNDNSPERNVRPEKYYWYEHAERNAIYNKAQDVLSGSLMFSSSFPNMDSARAISSSGIKKFITQNIPEAKNEEEKEIQERVKILFKETKVELIELSQNMDSKQRLTKKYLKYLELARYLGDDFSKDPDSKVGAVILNEKTFSPIAFGYNGMPRGLNDTNENRLKLEEKGFWFEDAEKNAIFNSVRPFFKDSTAFASFIPCMHCARALVSVGVKEVITREPDLTLSKDQRWKDSFDRSIALFKEAGVTLTYIPQEAPCPTKKMKV